MKITIDNAKPERITKLEDIPYGAVFKCRGSNQYFVRVDVMNDRERIVLTSLSWPHSNGIVVMSIPECLLKWLNTDSNTVDKVFNIKDINLEEI